MGKKWGSKTVTGYGRVEMRNVGGTWEGDFYAPNGKYLKTISPMPAFDEARPPRHLGAAGMMFNVVVVR